MNWEEETELDKSYVEPDLVEDSTHSDDLVEDSTYSDGDSDSSGPKLDDTLTLIGLPPSPPDLPSTPKCLPKPQSEQSLLKNTLSQKFKPKIMSTPTKKRCTNSKRKLNQQSTKNSKSNVPKTQPVENNIMKNFLKNAKTKHTEAAEKKTFADKEMSKTVEIGQCPLCFCFFSTDHLAPHASSCEGHDGASDEAQKCGHCGEEIDLEMKIHIAACLEEIREKKRVQEILERKGTLRLNKRRKVDTCKAEINKKSDSQEF